MFTKSLIGIATGKLAVNTLVILHNLHFFNVKLEMYCKKYKYTTLIPDCTDTNNGKSDRNGDDCQIYDNDPDD